VTEHRVEKTYGEAEVATALSAYLRRGSLRAAEAETGIPWETIREWRKQPRWSALLAQVRHAHSEEIQRLCSAAARDAAEGLQEAVLRCRQALRRDRLSDRDAAIIGRTLASVIESVHRLVDPQREEYVPVTVIRARLAVRPRDGATPDEAQ
jgi:hypothetical protein